MPFAPDIDMPPRRACVMRCAAEHLRVCFIYLLLYYFPVIYVFFFFLHDVLMFALSAPLPFDYITPQARKERGSALRDVLPSAG